MAARAEYRRRAAWLQWLESCPDHVRAVAQRFDPWTMYRLISTGQRARFLGCDVVPVGRVTLRVYVEHPVLGEASGRQVFGIDPYDLAPWTDVDEELAAADRDAVLATRPGEPTDSPHRASSRTASEDGMTVAEYMSLRCLCGRPRGEHVHVYADALLPGDVLNPNPVDLRVVGMTNDCQAFTWEMERELTGNPLANKHLRPLMVEGD